MRAVRVERREVGGGVEREARMKVKVRVEEGDWRRETVIVRVREAARS